MPMKITQPGGKENVARLQARSQPSSADHSTEPRGMATSLLNLQRTHGNHYVQRVLALARSARGEAVAGRDVQEAIHRARGGGQALDTRVRARMESVFGSDFSGVRVHTDARADALNRALNARAFTTGQDIFFSQGTYHPASASGRSLLAHELTHVVQQSGSTVQRKLAIGEPGDQYEQEADQVAEAVLRMSEPQAADAIAVVGQAAHIQRKCSACEEELRLKPKEQEEDKGSPRSDMIPGIAGKGAQALEGYNGARPADAIVAHRPVRLSFGISRIQRSIIQRQPTVRSGSIGCPVPELQDSLNATGEALNVDGIFGPLTAAAVRRFQTAPHPPHPRLVVDGVVGPLTWGVLHDAAPGDHGLPSGEDIISNGWGTGVQATNHRWRQQLTPTTTNFKNCEVIEADGGSGSDTCWFAGSIFAPALAITGGRWPVEANNFWGDDFIGWFTNAVTYYRSQGRAPCQASFIQSMRVVRPSGDVEYIRHRHVWGMGTTTVSSTRDGHTETRNWP